MVNTTNYEYNLNSKMTAIVNTAVRWRRIAELLERVRRTAFANKASAIPNLAPEKVPAVFPG